MRSISLANPLALLQAYEAVWTLTLSEKAVSSPTYGVRQLEVYRGVKSRPKGCIQVLLSVCGPDHNATLPFKAVKLPQQHPENPSGGFMHVRPACICCNWWVREPDDGNSHVRIQKTQPIKVLHVWIELGCTHFLASSAEDGRVAVFNWNMSLTPAEAVCFQWVGIFVCSARNTHRSQPETHPRDVAKESISSRNTRQVSNFSAASKIWLNIFSLSPAATTAGEPSSHDRAGIPCGHFSATVLTAECSLIRKLYLPEHAWRCKILFEVFRRQVSKVYAPGCHSNSELTDRGICWVSWCTHRTIWMQWPQLERTPEGLKPVWQAPCKHEHHIHRNWDTGVYSIHLTKMIAKRHFSL